MPSDLFPFLENPTGEQRSHEAALAPSPGNNYTLYQWGPNIQFKVYPVNIHEFDHETATDWAQKEIAGGAIYREWVGENDEHFFIRGRVFPSRFGGLSTLDTFDTARRHGIVNLLVRGDGHVMGWFVCEKLVRAHTFLNWAGIGQQIAFEAQFTRVPAPANITYFPNNWRATG